MTDKRILKRAIQRAESNGYKCPINFYDKAETEFSNDGTIDNGGLCDEQYISYSIQQIIFSHDFAKAFWGEDLVNNLGNKCDNLHSSSQSEWEFNLQEMVLKKEPLKYLEGFLNE